MAFELNPKQFQAYFENAAKANANALEIHAQYAEQLVKRTTSALVDLADGQLESVKDMTGAKSFTAVYESNLALLEDLQDKLKGLYEDNVAAFEALQSELKDVYEIDTDLVAQMQKVADEVVATAQKVVEAVTPLEIPAKKPAAKSKAA